MSQRFRLTALSMSLGILGLIASDSRAQRVEVQSLGFLFPEEPVQEYQGQKISGDGNVIIGRSVDPNNFDPFKPNQLDAFRWTVEGGISAISHLGQDHFAWGLSSDASTVVGDAPGDQAFRWTESGGVEYLPSLNASPSSATARDASSDGTIVVGGSSVDDYNRHPVRWTASGVEDLGVFATDDGNPRSGMANAITPDGAVIVGEAQDSEYRDRAFRWTESSGLVDLDPLDTFPDQGSYAIDVSDDGSVIVGNFIAESNYFDAFVWTEATGMVDLTPDSADGEFANGIAVSGDGSVVLGYEGSFDGGGSCIWVNGEQYFFSNLLEQSGLEGWFVSIRDVSYDGTKFTGYGWSPESPFQMAIILTLDLHANRPPTIQSIVTEDSEYSVIVGKPFQATFTGEDADAGDQLTVDAFNLPAGASITPGVGTTGAAPLAATLNWTPTSAQFGLSRYVTISFTDQDGNVATRSFTLSVPANNVPKIVTPSPVTVECVEGLNFVELKATVSDADSHPMNVTWRVNGAVQKTQSGVTSGTQVSFSFNYPHGSHNVQIEVTDGYGTATSGTTVTVDDTTNPVVVVAGIVTVGTAPGKNFATGVILPPPSVTDNCDGVPTLTNNAPSVFPLGPTTVTWTAVDAEGNVATADQTVIVEDRERPTLVGGKSVTTFVNKGEIFATPKLIAPIAKDNVPAGLKLTDDAPKRFKIGKTTVTWTARDAAGNEAKKKLVVTVNNRNPIAIPGNNLTLKTSGKTATVKLNGSKSRDPDGHTLKYRWVAPKVKLQGATSAAPSGAFPIGTTKVTLTVTDEAGAKATKSINVTVKRKNTKARPRGAHADRSFAAASVAGVRNLRGRVVSGASLAGYERSRQAAAVGSVAGGEIRWSDEVSSRTAFIEYASKRQLQAALGREAAASFFAAYLETGDKNAYQALLNSAAGVAQALSDLSED